MIGYIMIEFANGSLTIEGVLGFVSGWNLDWLPLPDLETRDTEPTILAWALRDEVLLGFSIAPAAVYKNEQTAVEIE